MMNWHNYRDEIDQIKVDEQVKKRWKQTLHLSEQIQEQKRNPFRKMALATLCLFLVVTGILMAPIVKDMFFDKKIVDKPDIHPTDKPTDHVVASLPKLNIEQNRTPGGMGTTSLLLPNGYVFDMGNPWHVNSELKTLPVYSYKWIVEQDRIVSGGLSDEQMREKINFYKERFQFTKLKSENTTAPMFWIVSYLEGDIHVDRRNGYVSIRVNEGQEIIEGLQLDAQNRSEAEKVAMEAAKRFKSVLDIKNPVPAVHNSYDNLGTETWMLEVYDKKQTLADDILSYNFKKIGFSYMKDIGVTINIHDEILENKIGDYPIISVEEAKQKFIDGQYISFGYPPLEGADIEHMELVYYAEVGYSYLIPFYEVYVRMDPSRFMPIDGLTNYGTYYVPAIDSKYFEVTNITMH